MGRGDRPEYQNPPEIFYNDEEAAKYTTSSRMVEIQVSIVYAWGFRDIQLGASAGVV